MPLGRPVPKPDVNQPCAARGEQAGRALSRMAAWLLHGSESIISALTVSYHLGLHIFVELNPRVSHLWGKC